ncbi:MAG: hypothetical protein KDD33_01280 [Bdellovibrionales bacterium]|nr:hypothetical protein [Bdellovibrionales bacterium]
MDKLTWIKDLVRAEQDMEESGMISITTGFEPEKHLLNETLLFLIALKREFVDATTAFNQLKGSPLGRIKVYSISQTQADSMLFRNGCKLIFSMKQPGTVSMKFHRATGINPAFTPMAAEEEFLIAKWGPFGDLNWTYNNQPIKTDYLVKYYTTRFVHESAK